MIAHKNIKSKVNKFIDDASVFYWLSLAILTSLLVSAAIYAYFSSEIGARRVGGPMVVAQVGSKQQSEWGLGKLRAFIQDGGDASSSAFNKDALYEGGEPLSSTVVTMSPVKFFSDMAALSSNLGAGPYVITLKIKCVDIATCK